MKTVDIESSTYIDFDVKKKTKKNKDRKFEVDDHVWILKYKNLFAKGDVPF